MESGRKPRKRDRMLDFLKAWKLQPHQQITKAPTAPQTPPNDKERTKKRFVEAAKLLHKAVQSTDPKWGDLDILSGAEEYKDSQFQEKLDAVLEQNSGATDVGWLANCRCIMQYMFTAFSPLAKNFLRIATNAQSVGIDLRFLL